MGLVYFGLECLIKLRVAISILLAESLKKRLVLYGEE